MILKPSYAFESLYMHSYKVEIFCHFVLLGDIDYLLQFFRSFLFQLFLRENYVFSMKQLLKIVLILFDSPSSQCTDKTCFHILWLNYELKIETGNEKYKTKCPTDSRLWLNISKQNTMFFFLSQQRKKTYVITLEAYNVKALEVYNVKALEVYSIKALEVYNIKTLEMFIY